MNPSIEERTSSGSTWVVRALPALALAALLVVVALAVVRQDFQQERSHARLRLEATAELRATQIQDWAGRQMRLAYFLDDSSALAELFLKWQDGQDAAAGAALLKRITEFRQANDDDSALLVDARGQTLAREHPNDEVSSDELRAATLDAVARGTSTNTGIYRRDVDAAMPVRMDVVIPLLKTGRTARGALVLRIDPRRDLFPMLSSSPMAGLTAESVLWTRIGNRIVSTSNTLQAPGNGVRLEAVTAQSSLPLARVLKQETAADRAEISTDYRGAAVLAVARAIPGTDWWVVSKQDLAEIDEPIWRNARVVALAAALSLLGTGLLQHLWTQRRALARGRREHNDQRERLGTLGLLNAIALSTSDSIFAKNLEGRYIFFNRAASETFGMASANVVGRTNDELFDSATAANMTQHDRDVMLDHQPSAFEEIVQRADGDVTVVWTKGPLFDDSGALIGMLGVSRDVRETQRAERALHDSEAHYQSVVSALQEGVLVRNSSGEMVSCNPAAERILGMGQADWHGRTGPAPGWLPLRPDGSDMPIEETPVARVLAGEAPQVDVLQSMSNPAGESAWFEISCIPVFDLHTHAMTSVVTSFVDVTARRRLEADLLRHRDELEMLVNERTIALRLANEALEAAARFSRMVTDANPGRVAYWSRELRCLFANRSYATGVEREPAELIGLTIEEIYGADAPMVRTRMEAALAGEPQHFVRERALEGGEPFIQQVQYLPEWDTGGSVLGVYVMAFDITALKLGERALERTNEALLGARNLAESATRAKSAFLANTSHEIRTPLNAIIGLTFLMTRESRDPRQIERLTKVSAAAHHLLQVINDILDLSKIEAGKLTLDNTEFSLDDLMIRSTEMVGPRARDKGLELILDPDHLPRRLKGDLLRLSQMLINLLSNAVKFTESGWIRLRGEVVTEEETRLFVQFEVRDTGPGIALDRQTALFNVFEQADNSASRQYGGTGLGLALTRQLARAMGGEAGVTSAPGAGSTFWFTAWLGRASEAKEKPAASVARGLRVLLVDDLPEARSVIGERLTMMGLEVDSLGSGADAVDRAQAATSAGRPFDLFMIDWRMEPMDGIETLGRLRHLLGDATPPSILVTASDDASLFDRARQAHFNATMLKPVTASSLQDTIAMVFSEREAAPLRVEIEGADAEAMVRRRHNGQRVLLAEDNPVNREVATELLQMAGLVVETAEDGAQAIEMALSRRYDIVFMDVQMPMVDGLDATRAIRLKAGRGLPIIAMTANAFVEDRAECLAAGMNDHVAKPVAPALLYAMLLRWLPLSDREPEEEPTSEWTESDFQLPFVERLRALDGFDADFALRQVGGQSQFLARVLSRFVALYRSGLPKLLDASGTDDEIRTRWLSVCHSVRGAVAMIGAVALTDDFTELEHQLKDKTVAVAALTDAGVRVNGRLVVLVESLAKELAGNSA